MARLDAVVQYFLCRIDLQRYVEGVDEFVWGGRG